MCGIFAYLGNRQALELLVNALKRLEYRGYDSAGVGIHQGRGLPIKVCKKQGKVKNLEDASRGTGLEGTMGIAHTRWATHGKPSDQNSHPHTASDFSVAVVHNGVIENYRALKEQLVNKGYTFVSQTDTELLAHLVHDLRAEMPNASYKQIVASALHLCDGAYGVAFIFDDDPDLMIGARKGSPLILGIGKGEYMLASDASAIIEHTQDVVYLKENMLVEIRRSGYKLHDIDSAAGELLENCSPRSVDNPIVRLEMSLEEIEKAGFQHFMLKEIMDQPSALRNAMRGRVHSADGKWQIMLGGLDQLSHASEDKQIPLDRLANANRIIIVACGTSWHSGQIGKCVIESLAKIPVEVEYASEFRYRRPIIHPTDVVVAISQSGETADTLEAIKIAQRHKALTIGIVNVVGSSIARLTDCGVYLHAGPEIGVASTKAFTGQVMALLMIALRLAIKRDTVPQETINEYCKELTQIPDTLADWLPSLDRQLKFISKYFRLASNALFCGSGVQFPVALEGALKLKEISYIHAEGFSAAEVKHGPVTLVRNFVPMVVIAMKSDVAYESIRNSIREFSNKDAALVVLTTTGNEDFDGMASFVIECPPVKTEFSPLITSVPLQLLSYYIANMRGCNIDQPRNLAKSVTVE